MLTVLCLAVLAAAPHSQDYSQKLVGLPAPPLKFETVLIDGKSVNSPTIDLKGSVTLLEFWFTNCGPCRKAVPHLNKLVREFAPKGLKAYAVTFDMAEIVHKFLQEVPIVSPIAIDTAMATMKAYGVVGYPTTFLIGKDGRVLACTSPDMITEQVLSDALAGRPLNLRRSGVKPELAPVLRAETDDIVSSVRIAPTTSVGTTSYSVTPEKVEFKGVPLRRALQYLYRLDPHQSEMKLLPDDRIFDVMATVPGAIGEAATALLKAALVETFHLRVQVETKEIDVAVFRLRGPLKGVKPWNGKDRGAQGVHFMGSTLGAIVDSAAFSMGLVGIDETGDTNLYDFDMDYDESKPIPEQMLASYGIEVTKEKRKMPFTKIVQGS